MTTQTIGLLIGGLVPAFLFTISNLGSKGAMQAGIGMGPYILMIGIGVMVTGCIAYLIWPDHSVSLKSGTIALCFGISWGIGVGCVGFAIAQYGSNIGQLAPLFNINTLFTVVIALWLFSEWKNVHVPQLVLGSLFIIIGATLVAKA